MPFQPYGGYKIIPLKSPPSQRAFMKSPKLETVTEGFGIQVFDDILSRYDVLRTETSAKWEERRALHGSEIDEYLSAYNPLFVEDDTGMDLQSIHVVRFEKISLNLSLKRKTLET